MNEILALKSRLLLFSRHDVTPLLFSGRPHHRAIVGGQRLRSERAAVRANLPAREQGARQVCRTCGLRGRVQVRSVGQQLPLPGHIYPGDAASTHVARPVSTEVTA